MFVPVFLAQAASLNSFRPTIDGFFPSSGAPGTSVTINGSNLGSVREVRFNNGIAVFTSVSAARLIATVPLDATTGPISVTTAFGTVASVVGFTVAPRIISFSPTNGSPGTVVTLEGANFSGATAVRFKNQNAAAFTVTAETQIHATVPIGAGTGPLSVVTSAGTGQSTNDFTVIGPEPFISDFAPTNGVAGTVVVIEGLHFSGATAVKFNNLAARFFVTSPTQISATVPSGAATGFISITTPLGTGLSTKPFLATSSPIVTDFFPTNGPPGTLVTVTGFNFTGATAVRFNGTNAVFSVTAPTQISATVPANAKTGPISVSAATGTGTSDASFVVSISPLISSFAPTNGPPGTLVVIDGINFTGATAVKFNGANAASFSVTSPTQIHATVPVGATSGPIAITTTTGTGASADAFTVTAGLPYIASFSPATGLPGTSVTLEGRDFQGATAVKFNGTNAAFVVTAPTQIVCTVPNGALSGLISVTTPVGTGFSSVKFLVAPSISGFTPASGVAGSEVAVRGTNFTDVIAVKFNGVAARFTNATPNQIAAIVPTNGTSGRISVTTPAGIVASTNDFTILPNVLGFTPPAGPIGTRVTIFGTHLGDATVVQFNGINAPFTAASREELTATVPFGAANGPITVITPGGTSRSADGFVVSASADVALTLTASPTPLALGGTLTFTIVLTNLGPSLATSVNATNFLPSNALFVSAAVSQGSYRLTDGIITASFGNIASSAGVKLTVVVTPTTTGELTNRVTAKGGEFDPFVGNNSAELKVPVLTGPTTLRIELLSGGRIGVSWPTVATNFVLQAANQLGASPSWFVITNTAAVSGGQKIVTVPVTGPGRFFRLSKP